MKAAQQPRSYLATDGFGGNTDFTCSIRVNLSPMKLTAMAAPHFDLAVTLDSGQTFHWEPHGAGFAGTIGHRALYIEQRGDELHVPRGLEELASRYFALDHPLEEICTRLPTDAAMVAARDYCRGLRIMRQ
jgi:N-glycosylase/DNA lyase